MRILALVSLLVGCAPGEEPEPGAGLPPVVVDLEGTHGPERPPPRFVRAAHLRFDLGDVDLSFNDTGIRMASDVPAGGATPYLPLGQVDIASFQAYQDGDIVAEVDPVEVEPGTGVTLAVYGHAGEPRSMALPTNLVGEPGEILVRAVHVTFDLPFVGVLDDSHTSLASLLYGRASSHFSITPDVPHQWMLDLSANGSPDLVLEPFELPALDSDGRPQVVDAYFIPSGVYVPISATAQIQIPALLLVPLDAPDGIRLVVPEQPEE
ncbi:MAG: DUF4397 domain-containing protein [Deltaproteobacteria bacterium]|nr:MAG: DUF4397 domain-containing protein [Deltaproteobacteria bacterium]